MTRIPDPLRRVAARSRGPLVALFAALALVSPGTMAQGQSSSNLDIAVSEGGSRRIELGIGKSVIIDLPRDAKEVFVANPKVANAIVRSTRKIFIIGAADGQTNVVVMDGEGRQIANLDVNIGRDLNTLRRTLKAAMPTSAINIVPVGDTIVLTGSVASAGDALQAVDISKGFVGASPIAGSAVAGTVVNSLTIRGRDQVMLKVTIAEIQRTILKQLGIDMSGSWQIGNLAGTAVINNPLTLQSQAITNTLFKGALNGANGPNFTLQAAERVGAMRTLAEPTLTAISGETAKFNAGGRVPVPSGQSCAPGFGCATSITYEKIGVALNFTPIVLSEGRISLHVSTEVVDIDRDNTLRYGDGLSANAPAFKTRNLDTTVELPSGASLVSAGLIQSRSAQVINGLPGLMNVPVLGALFRSRDYQRQESELLIVVTPYIAKPTSPQKVALPTDGFSDASDPQAILLGRFNRLYGSNGAPASVYKGRAGFVID
ncbi:MAG: type II and III secretion system protein family protein [Alsobacter sp.]